MNSLVILGCAVIGALTIGLFMFIFGIGLITIMSWW